MEFRCQVELLLLRPVLGIETRAGGVKVALAVEPEPDRIWILNQSHITGSGLPDSVDPAQYPDINPDIRL